MTYDINVINHSNMGIKRTVSIRVIQLWLLNQLLLLILQRKMQKTKLSSFPLGNPFINLKCFVAILNDWIFGQNFPDILFGKKIMGKIFHTIFFCKNQILINLNQLRLWVDKILKMIDTVQLTYIVRVEFLMTYRCSL